MMYNNLEFLNIIEDILSSSKFIEIKGCIHHGISRYDHCLRVSYYTFLLTKFLKLNYREATRAALLHDFFTDEVKDLNGYKRLVEHPKKALINSKKYFELSELQEDIIIKHMFPVTIIPPKYLESWIVDIVDDFSAIYERVYSMRIQLVAGVKSFLFLIVGFFIK